MGVSSAGVPSPELSPSLEAEAVRLTMTVTEEETVPLETMTEVAPVLTPVMTPLPSLAMGTLKSQRSRTFLPFTSMSRTVFF